jgi:hypothetical protein
MFLHLIHRTPWLGQNLVTRRHVDTVHQASVRFRPISGDLLAPFNEEHSI